MVKIFSANVNHHSDVTRVVELSEMTGSSTFTGLDSTHYRHDELQKPTGYENVELKA